MLKVFFGWLLFIIALTISTDVIAQANPYQKQATAKYVKTTRDTVTLSGFIDEKKTGIITNESASKELEVFFGKRATTPAIDSTAYFKLPAGKTLLFQTGSTRIYRRATSDSVYSQVLMGNVNMGFNDGGVGSFELVNWRGYEFIIIDNKNLVKALRRSKALTL